MYAARQENSFNLLRYSGQIPLVWFENFLAYFSCFLWFPMHIFLFCLSWKMFFYQGFYLNYFDQVLIRISFCFASVFCVLYSLFSVNFNKVFYLSFLWRTWSRVFFFCKNFKLLLVRDFILSGYCMKGVHFVFKLFWINIYV